jgi:hypothetical protein
MARDGFKVRKSANLQPQSSDPTDLENGDIWYNDAERVFKGRQNDITKRLSNEPRDLDIFHAENFDSVNALDFVTGNNATPDGAGTGTFLGLLQDRTAGAISGTKSLEVLTFNNNDFFLSPEITVQRKQQGQIIGISFYYETTAANDNEVRFVLYDETNDTELSKSNLFLPASSDSKRFETAVFIPDNVTSIRFGFQAVATNLSASMQVDDIELSTDPFVYKDLLKKNEISLRGNDGRAITANTEDVHFSGSGSGWTSSGDDNYYTVQNNNSTIHISGSINYTSSVGSRSRLYVNGAFYKNMEVGGISSVAHKFETVLAKGEVSAGDQLSIRATGTGTLNNDTEEHNLTISEQWQAEHIVTAAQSSETRTKYLASNVTTDSADITDLKFTDLVVGNWYMVTLNSMLFHNATSADADVDVVHDGNTIIYHRYDSTSSSTNGWNTFSGTKIFQATSDTLTVTFDEIGSSAFILIGNGTETGTNIQLTNLTTQFLTAIPVQQTAYVKHVTTDSSDGGSASSNTNHTRTLNVLEGDTGFLSLSSNQITIQPGTYYIEATASAYRVNNHQAMLYNVTDSAVEIAGSPSRSTSTGTDGVQSTSFIRGKLVLTQSKAFELRHWTQTAKSSNGFGLRATDGTNNPATENVWVFVAITKTK